MIKYWNHFAMYRNNFESFRTKGITVEKEIMTIHFRNAKDVISELIENLKRIRKIFVKSTNVYGRFLDSRIDSVIDDFVRMKV